MATVNTLAGDSYDLEERRRVRRWLVMARLEYMPLHDHGKSR
jgi:hypothetical protein